MVRLTITRQVRPAVAPAKPKNYMVPAILGVILGCWPLAVVAIVFAAQVDGTYKAGDYAGAESASNQAKLFTILSFVSIILLMILFVFLSLLAP